MEISGHVRVYSYDGTRWDKLGEDIQEDGVSDRAGYVSISSDGKIIAIGAPQNDGNGVTNSGHVRVFSYYEKEWSQMGVDIQGENANDFSGYAVSISSDGMIVAVGARDNDRNGENSGNVRVYSYTEGQWNQMRDKINAERSGDLSGFAVSI